MFPSVGHFSHIRCRNTECGVQCPFKHEGETDTSRDPYKQARPSKSYEELSLLVDIELAKFNQLPEQNQTSFAPHDISVNNSVNYVEGSAVQLDQFSILEPNSTTTLATEAEDASLNSDAEFSEEETEEEKIARDEKHKKYMALLSKSKTNTKHEEVY